MFVSLEHSVTTINGHVLEGWADDQEALMIPDIDLTNVSIGADGLLAASSTGQRGGAIEFKFQPHSPSVQFFGTQLVRYLRGAPVIFQGSIVDQAMGVSIRLDSGVLQTGPLGQSRGNKAPKSQVYKIFFQLILPNYDGMKTVAAPVIAGDITEDGS